VLYDVEVRLESTDHFVQLWLWQRFARRFCLYFRYLFIFFDFVAHLIPPVSVIGLYMVEQFSGRQGQGHNRALIYHWKRLIGKGLVDWTRNVANAPVAGEQARITIQ